MRRPRIVTLTTDIGPAYAAQMKAVLYRSLRPGQVVDLTHDLPPHAIREAAFVLRQIARGFPAGTVHVAVIDPGVGGRRKPVAVRTADGSTLVGPDNGVLSPLCEALGGGRAYRLRSDRSWTQDRIPSATFDGRDLFAPAAARLARGVSPRSIGDPTTLLSLPLPRPVRDAAGARGRVAHVDHFGNLITDLPTSWLPARVGSVVVRLGSGAARRLPRVRVYEEIGRRGAAAVLGSSFGTLEVSRREASAAERYRGRAGQPVRLSWGPGPRSRRKEGI
jgi:S-adenosyl-L-methionine hydrolase (adenosine-forming)